MAGRWMRPGIARWLSGLLASVLMVAAASGLNALLEPWVSQLRALYVLAVMPVAVVWGTGLAVFAAVLSAAVYEYLFVSSAHSLRVADLRSAVALGRLPGHGGGHGGAGGPAAEGGAGDGPAVGRAGRAAAGGHARRAGGTARGGLRRGHRGDRAGAVRRPHQHEPVRRGRRGDGRGPVGQDGRSLAAGDRRPGEPGRPELEHAGVPDGPAARIDDYDDSSGAFGRTARGWGLRSAVGVPISVQGRLWGMVTVGYARTAAAPADTEQRLADFTELVATAIANAQVQAELTASRARIVAAGDETRRRIEREPARRGAAAAGHLAVDAERYPQGRDQGET